MPASRDYDDDGDAGSKPADFVRRACAGSITSSQIVKLYAMLEDTSHADVVAWVPGGESFVVKELSSFSKERVSSYRARADMPGCCRLSALS